MLNRYEVRATKYSKKLSQELGLAAASSVLLVSLLYPARAAKGQHIVGRVYVLPPASSLFKVAVLQYVRRDWEHSSCCSGQAYMYDHTYNIFDIQCSTLTLLGFSLSCCVSPLLTTQYGSNTAKQVFVHPRNSYCTSVTPQSQPRPP